MSEVSVVDTSALGRKRGVRGHPKGRPVDPQAVLSGQLGDVVYYGLLGVLAGLVGLVFLLFAPRIRKLMAGVD